MPAQRIPMRKIKDVLRLKLDAKLSHEQIARSLGLSKGVVTKYVGLAAAAGLSWSQIQSCDDVTLERQLLVAPQRPRTQVQPDYARVHHELRRKGVTLMAALGGISGRACRAPYLPLFPILREIPPVHQATQALNAANPPRRRETVHRFCRPHHFADRRHTRSHLRSRQGRLQLYICLRNTTRNHG